jgi:protein Hikeshi
MVTVSQTQSAFFFPPAPHFSHIVLFMLPGNTLPEGTAAAVYMQLPGESQFKLLGAIGNEKQSAIFKVNLGGAVSGNEMMDATNRTIPIGEISLGISIEPATSIQAQLANLQSEASPSTALVRRPPTTKVLAQRIIKNAFNFLASFSGTAGGQEVVPLKSFQDWWKKFETRVENDPGFLERDDVA